MHTTTITAASFAALASLVQAVPHTHSHRHAHHIQARDDANFDLHVHNKCGSSKTFALYQISPAFEMTQMSNPVEIEPNCSTVIQAPFTALGMRLSATADQGTDAQWEAQTLFEFGYSTYLDLTGTAYDLSVMGGTEDECIAAYPSTSECESKVCTASGCTLAEAWTSADQATGGSPADTVCYQGKQNFKIVWCPE